MKFQKFEYKKINSTNDIAIKKIKFGYLSGIVLLFSKKKLEVSMEKNGFLSGAIYLCQFFLM